MSDSTETGDRKKASGGKTLSLKRTVETGQVRQSFSRGRTKSVVVEKKRKRTIRSGEGEGQVVEEAPTDLGEPFQPVGFGYPVEEPVPVDDVGPQIDGSSQARTALRPVHTVDSGQGGHGLASHRGPGRGG